MESLFCKIENFDITKPENIYDIQQHFEDELFLNLCRDDMSKFNNLLSLLLYMRDVRNGRGIREASYFCLQSLMKLVFCTNWNIMSKEEYFKFVNTFIHVGSWRDIRGYLHILINDEFCSYDIIKMHIQEIIIPQLVEDRKNMSIEEEVSNIAKWLPREKSNYKELAKMIAIEYCKYAHPHMSTCNRSKRQKYKIYRTMIASLNKYIDTTQIHMCAREWDKINFDYVTGNTIKKNHFAFAYPDWKFDKHRRQCARNFENHMNRWSTQSTLNFIHNQNYTFHEDYKNYIPCFLNNDPECVNIGMQMMNFNIFKKGYSHNKTPHEFDSSDSNIYDFNSTKEVSISLLYQHVLALANEKNLSDKEVRKLKIVIITKFKTKECIIPTVKSYESSRKGIYEPFFEMIAYTYRRKGYTKIPQIVFWNINRNTDENIIKKKMNVLLDNTLILNGFHKYAFMNPLHKKYITKQNMVGAIDMMYQNKISSIYK